jgi:hypothetical protein
MRGSSVGGVRVIIGVALGIVLVLSALSALADASASLRGVRGSGGSNMGNGFYTLTSEQTVTATGYWDNFNCPSQAQFRWCVDPVGVSYISPANVVVISEENCRPAPGCNGTQNALGELLGTNSSLSAPILPLGCFPAVPYYPGAGALYYVPCTNGSFAWQSVLSVDYQTDSLVANISVSAGATSLAYDTSNGLLYTGSGGNITAIDPTTDTTAGVMHIPDSTFEGGEGVTWSWYSLVYDPFTNTLIVPSSEDQLLSVNPANGAVEASMALPGLVQALAIDPGTDELFASTLYSNLAATNASAVSVFDATSLSLEAGFTIPPCVDYICTQPDQVSQILIDPAHGDAYLVGTTALFALNLSTLSLVGSIEDYGDGSQWSSTFVSASDAIVGTYAPFMVGPGFLLLLQHGTVTTWTSFLWLPPALGELALLLVAVAMAALVALVTYRAWKARRDRRRAAPPPVPGHDAVDTDGQVD